MNFEIPLAKRMPILGDNFGAVLEASTRSPLIVLAGPVGTGKTCDACTFVHESAKFVKASALWRTYGHCDLWNELLLADQVILDDLGTRVTDGSKVAILELVDIRVDHLRQTIITTNWSYDEVFTFSPRLASRIRQAHIVKYTGPDLRLSTDLEACTSAKPPPKNVRFPCRFCNKKFETVDSVLDHEYTCRKQHNNQSYAQRQHTKAALKINEGARKRFAAYKKNQ